MTKARDLANLGGTAATLVTSGQVAALAEPIVIEDIMDSK
jgi:hypothetical protein